ncbi:hypothetical protein [Streptomyces sp. NPDC058758]|uniref:hypothetical protein n=1 Tax=Streptomyces sp. NPDC058758 TaxID=3346627 RepID=UPI0036C39D76
MDCVVDGQPGDPAAGFGVGIATVYRYICEAVEALARLVPSLAEALRTIREKAFALLDAPCCRSTASPPTSPIASGRTSATA